jgi:hypothetical protein
MYCKIGFSDLDGMKLGYVVIRLSDVARSDNFSVKLPCQMVLR